MIRKFGKQALMLGILGVALIGGSTVSPGQAEASTNPFLGEIQLYPYNFAPIGWMKAEGQLLLISENSTLFSLIGTNFGGDGRTTFALPDLRGASPVPGVSYFISMTGTYPSRP
ncbi:phage tail protein [Paenibacillus jiagnxiensis]|uniref:phage tail protein n=1 Tax=Paenibacillus jiagnxiensis TaxID=3228926 RepID=UPI0033AD4AE0